MKAIDRTDENIVLVGDGCQVLNNKDMFNIKGDNIIDPNKKGLYSVLVCSIDKGIAHCACMGDFFDIKVTSLITTHRQNAFN